MANFRLINQMELKLSIAIFSFISGAALSSLAFVVFHRPAKLPMGSIPVIKPESTHPPAQSQPAAPAPQILLPDSGQNLAVFSNYLTHLLSRTHGPLFVMLSASSSRERLQKLQQILSDRDIKIAEIRRDQKRGQDIKSSLRKIDADAETKIKAECGESIAMALDSYEATTAQRQLVDQANRTLIYSGNPLSGAQTERVITLMRSNSSTPLSADASLERVDAYVKERQIAFSRVLAEVTPEFSPAQLVALRSEFDVELAYLDYYKMRKIGAIGRFLKP